jgi:hypothetical protein
VPISDFLLELSRVAIGLGLSIWIGGTFLALVTARTLFAALPSRAQAGGIFGDVIHGLDRAKFAAAGAMLVAVLMEVQIAGSSLAPRHVVRAALLFLLIAVHVYSVMVVAPKMRYYREKVADLDAAAAADPWRAKFQNEHRKSGAVTAVGLVVAVLALLVG